MGRTDMTKKHEMRLDGETELILSYSKPGRVWPVTGVTNIVPLFLRLPSPMQAAEGAQVSMGLVCLDCSASIYATWLDLSLTGFDEQNLASAYDAGGGISTRFLDIDPHAVGLVTHDAPTNKLMSGSVRAKE